MEVGSGCVYLLGSVRSEQLGAPVVYLRSRQAALVLVWLGFHRGQPASADALAELLWPDGPGRHWEGAVRGVIAKVRAFLDRGDRSSELSLGTIGRSYVLEGPDHAVDLWAASHALTEAEALLDQGHIAEAETSAISAADLLAPALEQGTDARAIDELRGRLVAMRGRALRTASRAASANAHHDQAGALAQEAVLLDDLHEESHRCLIMALLSRGATEEALGAYGRCRQALADQLGVPPSAETEALYVRLLEARASATPTPAAQAARPAGTPTLAPASVPFVGRVDERELLRAASANARRGRRQVVLVRGEAGVGKTRLVLESIASLRPGNVLYGRCSPEQVLPFEPFAEALRRHLHHVSDEELGTVRDAGGPHLAGLLPELEDDRGTPVHAGDDNRAALFESVRAVLDAVANDPTVFVLDDLHWASPSTLLLLRHVAKRIAESHLLLVVIYRDDDTPTAAFSDTVVDLHRLASCSSIALRGLGDDEVAALLLASGFDGAKGISAALRDRTGGSPLYLTEILATVADVSQLTGEEPIPGTVRELVHTRVGSLTATARDALAAAAVLGSTFPSSLLEAVVTKTAPGSHIEAIDELVGRQLLLESDDDSIAFTHAIVREAVYEHLSPEQRSQLHLRAARAIEHWRSSPADDAQLAHHYFLADDPDTADTTIDATIVAADAFLEAMAYEQSAELYQRAISLIDHHRPADPRRAACHLGRGAALRRAGDFAAARASLETAIELATGPDTDAVFGEATLELVAKAGRGVAVDMGDLQRASRLQSAIDRLGESHAPLLVPLLSELALALMLSDQDQRRRSAAERSLEVAARSGRADLIAAATVAHRLLHPRPDGATARLRHTDDLLPAAIDSRLSSEQVVRLRMWRLIDCFELGDRQGVDVELQALSEAARRLQQPYWLWVAGGWEALCTFVDGHADRADAKARSALALVADLEHPETVLGYGLQLVAFRLHQGRGREVVDLLERASRENPNIPGMRCALAFALAQAGDLEGTRQHLTALGVADFRALPVDANWSVSITSLAESAVVLRDVESAARLLPLIEPFRDRFIVVNGYGGGGTCWGPFSGVIAGLEACLGDEAGARRSYEDALAATERFRAPIFTERLLAARRQLDESGLRR